MLSERLEDNRILIVDRAPFIRDALRRSLLALGAQTVDTAPNASRAISLCRQAHYDLLLIDYDLGDGKNGQQLLEELRELRILRNSAAVMVISADTARDVVLSTLEYQPDDYLAKPYPQHLLARRVKRLLRFKSRLHPLFRAIDDEDYLGAIDQARRYLQEESEFRGNCLRILGHLCLAIGDTDEAAAIYRDELARDGSDWAAMGLGRVHLQQRQWVEAERQFASLIERNYLYVDAYEHLASVYMAQDQPERAEAVMARAVLVSPKSLRRQQLYARLCERNSRYDRAAAAWREAARIARNSRHEGAQLQLSVSRCLAEFCELRNAFSEERVAGEALKNLDFLRAKFRPQGDAQLQALLIEGRLHLGRGNRERSRSCLKEAGQLYAASPADYSAESRLEYARSLHRSGDAEQARELMAELLREEGLDPALLARADKSMDEPVSDEGRRKIIELNRRGIELFKAENYREARAAFTLAHARFPRNTELNLNLLQALLRLIRHGQDSREREEWLTEAEGCLHLIGQLPHDHPKYATWRRLLHEITELQRAG